MKPIMMVAVLFASFISISTNAQDKKPERKFINPEGLSKPTSYTHVELFWQLPGASRALIPTDALRPWPAFRMADAEPTP